jgi:uncharacterized protein YlxP (DUF503 family)
VVVGIARVTLHLPAARSLKDKRQVVKSLIAQAQHQFQLSVAEIDQLDQWQIGVLGLAYVSTSARHADEVIARAVSYIAGLRGEALLVDYETEVVHAL